MDIIIIIIQQIQYFFIQVFDYTIQIIQLFHISNIEIFGFLLIRLGMIEEEIDRFAFYDLEKMLWLLLCYVLVKM